MPYCPVLLAALLLASGVTTDNQKASAAAQAGRDIDFDVPALMECYQRNNEHKVPVVSYMTGGVAKVAIFPDGTVITTSTPSDRSRSGLLVATLSNGELASVLTNIASVDGFWSLSNSYKLSRASDQGTHRVSVRVGARQTKEVSVYGNLKDPRPGDTRAPAVSFENSLRSSWKFSPKV